MLSPLFLLSESLDDFRYVHISGQAAGDGGYGIFTQRDHAALRSHWALWTGKYCRRRFALRFNRGEVPRPSERSSRAHCWEL